MYFHYRQFVPALFLGICILFLSACQETPEPVSTTKTTTTPSISPAEDNADGGGSVGPVDITQYGPIRGYVEGDMRIFKGVRSGADTATTHFQPPAQPEPWTEPLDAFQFGPSAPQENRPFLSLFESWIPEKDPGNREDCLFLNVWTPAVGAGKRPVMVWLHGGGFTSGSGYSNAYDGTCLADRGDVVVVTVNHRLNVFGYTFLDEYGDEFKGSANAGMLDLVAALQWVQDNISQFGGDPDNVLIFGESGGGWKVSTLMAMEAADGLFHKAVAQSGPGLELMDTATAALATNALVKQLGLDEDSIDKIRTLPTAVIAEAAQAVTAAGGPRLGNRPVVDGIHNKRHPFTPDAPAISSDVPLLIGSTQTEMSLLAGAARPELFELTWESLPAALAAGIPGIDADAAIEGYRQLHSDIDASNLYFEATTDNSIFGRGSFTLADRKAQQGGAPVYQYYMTWRSPVEG